MQKHNVQIGTTYVVKVSVRDLYGLEANATQTFPVASVSPMTTSASSGVPGWDWVLVGIVVVGALAGVYYVRRRKSPPLAQPPPGPES